MNKKKNPKNWDMTQTRTNKWQCRPQRGQVSPTDTVTHICVSMMWTKRQTPVGQNLFD